MPIELIIILCSILAIYLLIVFIIGMVIHSLIKDILRKEKAINVIMAEKYDLIISLGTLISIYLTTSDEMIPILLANKVETSVILKILGLKLLIGIICGFIIDFIFRKKKEKLEIKKLCEDDHCHCNHNHSIVKSSLKHTLSITLFILIMIFIINLIFEYLGEEFLSKIFLKNSIFSNFIASIVGLIPNCGSSIMITELYLNNTITFGAMMSGLLTGSGIGILILFKSNKKLKENVFIMTTIYTIGVLSGIVIDLIGIVLWLILNIF